MGLTVSYTKLLLKRNRTKPVKIVQKHKSPRDAAIAELKEEMHPKCRKIDIYQMCDNCFSRMSILESEYDENGWPYSWAMHGQERYIEACS